MICLDIGGVLVTTCEDWLTACQRCGLECRGDVTERISSKSARLLFRQYELGLIHTSIMFDELARVLGYLYSPRELVTIHHAIIVGQSRDAHNLVETASESGARVALLSNTNALHWWRIRRFTVVRLVRDRFLSYAMHTWKPEPEVFLRVALALRVLPQRILYFDDQPTNVEAARAAGWQAEQFTSVGSAVARILAGSGLESSRGAAWTGSQPPRMK